LLDACFHRLKLLRHGRRYLLIRGARLLTGSLAACLCEARMRPRQQDERAEKNRQLKVRHEFPHDNFLHFLNSSRSSASAVSRSSLRPRHARPSTGFCSVAFFVVYEIHQNKDKEAHPGNAKGLENQDCHYLVLFCADPTGEDDAQGSLKILQTRH